MERQPRGRRELEAASVAQPPLLQKTKKENPREVGRGRVELEKTSSHHPALFNETTILLVVLKQKLRFIIFGKILIKVLFKKPKKESHPALLY